MPGLVLTLIDYLVRLGRGMMYLNGRLLRPYVQRLAALC